MNVLTFGATCSPCLSQYVNNKNAKEFQHIYPQAVDAIINHHYVDDWIQSFDTENDCLMISQQVIKVHSKGGFEIRNFMTNSKMVIKNVNLHSYEAVQFFGEESNNLKVLGLWWDPQEDLLFYQINASRIGNHLIDGSIIPTKREVLRILMMLFDPLGLLTHFVVHGKIIIREIWLTNVDWDQKIKEDQFQKWQKWTHALHNISEVRIPRWYNMSGYLELHVFVDASQQATAAVAYLRSFEEEAKSKVAPMKILSVPRLELSNPRRASC